MCGALPDCTLGGLATKQLKLQTRLCSNYRCMKAAEFFKVATSAVLMNSNVVERGMDFPGVTLAIEVGELIDVLLLKEGSVGGAGEEEFS